MNGCRVKTIQNGYLVRGTFFTCHDSAKLYAIILARALRCKARLIYVSSMEEAIQRHNKIEGKTSDEWLRLCWKRNACAYLHTRNIYALKYDGPGADPKPILPSKNMNVIYKGVNGNPAPQKLWTKGLKRKIERILAIVEGTNGFRSETETWRKCELHIIIGVNEYDTTAEIHPPAGALTRRRANWLNRYAEYSNGEFWGNVSKTKVVLI